jgi:hypothetical protein
MCSVKFGLTPTVFRAESDECGPFRHYGYPIDVILDVFEVTDYSSGFLLFIRFVVRPGVIALILLAMW